MQIWLFLCFKFCWFHCIFHHYQKSKIYVTTESTLKQFFRDLTRTGTKSLIFGWKIEKLCFFYVNTMLWDANFGKTIVFILFWHLNPFIFVQYIVFIKYTYLNKLYSFDIMFKAQTYYLYTQLNYIPQWVPMLFFQNEKIH